MKLYRVHPYIASAAEDQPGGVLFVPATGKGRFDNPKLYKAFYASTDPRCAIVERFGEADVWDDDTFLTPAHSAIGTIPLALSTYEIARSLIDLASIKRLQALSVERVTDVITRTRSTTQLLAASAFARYPNRAGLSWWSYYRPEWTNVMLWRVDGLAPVQSPLPLTTRDALVVETARILHRRLEPART